MHHDVEECLLQALTDATGSVLQVDPGPRLFQGAVGAVTLLRDETGTRYVVKTYGREASGNARTEAAALNRIRAHTDVPVPAVVAHGDLDDRPYLLLTYLPGTRWADRRAELTADDSEALAFDAAALLRRLHSIHGSRFGPLLDPPYDSLWSRVRHRCFAATGEYGLCGGSPATARRVTEMVKKHRAAFVSSAVPVLCHNDFIDGNLLLDRQRPPQIVGVVDLERAVWDDPLADLAKTASNVRHHDPVAAARLTTAYGATTPAESARLAVYDILLALEERNWVTHDRPPHWKRTIHDLDSYLARHV